MTAGADVCVAEFTDPACPWAWSAEPSRRRLQWLYGERLDWSTRMVVLADHGDDYLNRGFTPAKQASSFARIARDHGMPIDTSERPRMAASESACRAVVAARLHAAEPALLRAFRTRHFGGELLDDPQTIAGAAADARLDSAQLLANLVPGTERRDPPASVVEVLEWAGEPLATREVAVVCDIGHEDAREELGRVASERHLGFDGLWSAG